MRKLLLLCAFGLLLAGQAKAQPSAAFNGTESGAGTTVLGYSNVGGTIQYNGAAGLRSGNNKIGWTFNGSVLTVGVNGVTAPVPANPGMPALPGLALLGDYGYGNFAGQFHLHSVRLISSPLSAAALAGLTT